MIFTQTNYILAQANMDSAPADIFKWVIIILLAIFVIFLLAWTAFRTNGKQKVEIEPQPMEVRKQSKRYNHDQAEDRHREVTAQLKDHEDRLRQIERSRLNTERRFNKIWIVLTRIATKMDVTVPAEREEEEA